MYLILLKFTEHKARAAEFMAGHKCWLQTGFEQGLLVMAGSLGDGTGGALLAHGLDKAVLEAFVYEDPFVEEGIVRPEILHITPSRLDARLEFLRAAAP